MNVQHKSQVTCWAWQGGQHTPFPRKEDNPGFGSISQVGVLIWSLYFHWLSQPHGSCAKLPLFQPSMLFNIAHSEEEEYTGMTHKWYFADSGELGGKYMDAVIF